MRNRRLYTGRPVPRPLFAAGLVPAETPREREFRRISEFRSALEATRRDEVSLDEARAILARIGSMGSTTPPSLDRPRITDPASEGGAN